MSTSTITAADVKSLRERTGLPMMDCKKALTENDGNQDAAVDWLRERGKAIADKRADRETAFGRFGLFIGAGNESGAMVELQCESAPVAGQDEFVQLANDLAEALATGSEVADAEALLDLESPSQSGKTLREQKDELFNRIREVFNVGRMKRFDTATGGYSHNLGTVAGVIVSIEGGDDESAKDVGMHIVAMNPNSLGVDDLNAEEVAKEKEILRAAALAEGKPESIVDKMVEGRMRNFFAERVLLEQPFVKEEKMSVKEFAKSKNMKVKDYVHWILGEKSE